MNVNRFFEFFSDHKRVLLKLLVISIIDLTPKNFKKRMHDYPMVTYKCCGGIQVAHFFINIVLTKTAYDIRCFVPINYIYKGKIFGVALFLILEFFHLHVLKVFLSR